MRLWIVIRIQCVSLSVLLFFGVVAWLNCAGCVGRLFARCVAGCVARCLVCWVVAGWLNGQLIGWLAVWLVGVGGGRLVGWLAVGVVVGALAGCLVCLSSGRLELPK